MYQYWYIHVNHHNVKYPNLKPITVITIIMTISTGKVV